MMAFYKKLFLLFLLGLVIPLHAQSGDTTASRESASNDEENLACMSRTLRAFYAEYDGHLGPEPVRRAKFNAYVDCVDPSMSKEERDQAFRVVDAYIRGDGEWLPEDKKREIRAILRQMNEQYRRDTTRGMEVVRNQTSRIRQMSYTEYAAYVRELNPGFTDRQIAQSYNSLHQSDGRRVPVPEENPEEMTQVKALEIATNPGDYDYPAVRRAFLFLDPKMKEDDIRKIWEEARRP